jgi:deazaflavin-dependent oxidoreductase (nitroreductase family)
MDERPDAVGAALSPSLTLTLIRRVARPIWLRVGLAAAVEIPDRRSGTPVHVTLIPWEVDGTWYLLSHYGVARWVRNIRAQGRCELHHKGRSEAFNAIEVEGDERDRVIATFRARTPKPFRRDFERRPGAADHPTFKLQSLG